MAGGSKTPSRTTQVNEPWSGVQPHLTTLFNDAAAAKDATPTTVYDGARTAGPSANELAARQSALGFANGELRDMSNAYVSNISDTIAGKYLNPGTNQYVTGMADAITKASNQNMLDTVLPQVHSGAIASGAFGGARQQLLDRYAVAKAQAPLNETIAKMYLDNYNAERSRMLNPELFAAGSQAGLASSAIMQQVGAAERRDQQAINDDAIARFRESITAPWEGINRYAAILNGTNVPASSTMTQPGQGAVAGGLTGALGGAATGASIGSMFGPGYGTAIGAIGGGILGGLGGVLGR